MQRVKPLVQRYEQYTDEDFLVWKLLFERQMANLQYYASTSYQAAVQTVGFTRDEIPDFKKLNNRLMQLTGWQLTVVPELVLQMEFFELLSQRIFPATCWLRTMTELDYIEEPDMFHDVFGHVPLLANTEYADFMQRFGQLALLWQHEPYAIGLLGRIYWFTIEFGLVKEQGSNKAFGAGIISSPGEIRNMASAGVEIHPFSIEDILQAPYITDALQQQYFVLGSFMELPNVLTEIIKWLHSNLSLKG